MKIRILYDNKSSGQKVRTGWGFSVLIGDSLLFDTGEDYAALEANARAMDVDLKRVKSIVLSHEHWDHIDGLWGLLARKKSVTVACCPGFSKGFKEKVKRTGADLVEVARPRFLGRGVWSTGEIKSLYKRKPIFEQALVLRNSFGICLITGCAHPGILEIVRKMKKSFKGREILLCVGGFHLKDHSEQEIRRIGFELAQMGVQQIGPAHCSGEQTEQILREMYGRRFVEVGAGKTIDPLRG